MSAGYPARKLSHSPDKPSCWGLAIVRTLRVGSRQLIVETLGAGVDANPCTYAAAPSCKDDRKPLQRARERRIVDTVSLSPALHHGKDFDVVFELRRRR